MKLNDRSNDTSYHTLIFTNNKIILCFADILSNQVLRAMFLEFAWILFKYSFRPAFVSAYIEMTRINIL